MKSVKFIYILIFFNSLGIFSQNPVIENTTLCIKNESTTTIEVLNPFPSATYIWQFKNPTDINWTDITISNAGFVYQDYNTSELGITRKNTIPLSQTQYRVIVNNGSGNQISNEAVLTISPLSVAKTISGASPVCMGGDKLLSYAPESVGNIQWQSSTISATTGFENIDSENGINYNATDILDTTWYRVMNTSGSCGSVFSPVVQVVVNSLAQAGEIEGGDVSVCITSNVTDLFLNNYQGSIQWQRASFINGPYTSITNARSEIYRASLLTSSTYFRVAVSSGVCPTEFSEPVLIDVTPASVSRTISGVSTVCEGKPITLTYSSGFVGDIQWQSSTTSALIDFVDETDETGTTLNLNTIQETTWFRVVNTSGECSPAFSQVFKVTVNPLAEEGTISGADGAIVCRTSNSTPLNLFDSVGNIQWQRAIEVDGEPGIFTNISLATRDSYTASSLTETSYFRATLTSGDCPIVIASPVKIVVDQPAIVKTISGASPVCFDGSKVLVYEPGSFGEIQWQASTTSGTSGFIDIPGENSEILTAYNLTETTWFRVSNTNGVCNPINSPAVRVIVNPNPISGVITIVEGNDSLSINSRNAELSLINYNGNIQWQKSKSLTEDFINITGATSSIFRTSELKETTYFRTVVSNGECSNAISEPVAIKPSIDFDVTLFPNPFNEEFNINLNSLNREPIEFEVYDMLGRRVDYQTFELNEINSKKIGSNYLSGFYTIAIKQGERNKSIKVLKK